MLNYQHCLIPYTNLITTNLRPRKAMMLATILNNGVKFESKITTRLSALSVGNCVFDFWSITALKELKYNRTWK